jgi:hypothetical protein
VVEADKQAGEDVVSRRGQAGSEAQEVKGGVGRDPVVPGTDSRLEASQAVGHDTEQPVLLDR